MKKVKLFYLLLIVLTLVTSCDKAEDTESVKETGNSISSFVVEGAEITLDKDSKTVTIEVSSDVDITKITPTFEISSKASVSPASGVVQDFTNPVVYTITAEDNSVEKYTATVVVLKSDEKKIKTFTGDDVTFYVLEDDKFIYGEILFSSSKMEVAPVITISEGSSISPKSGVVQPFNEFVIYTVTAEDGSTELYTMYIVNSLDVFISSWDLGVDEFILPFEGKYGNTVTVNWGDGTTTDEGVITHTYSETGEYTIKTKNSLEVSKFDVDIDGLYIGDNTDYTGKLTKITSWGDIVLREVQSTDAYGLFDGCYRLNIETFDYPNLLGVTSLRKMFDGCQSLRDDEFIDWDVSNITNMENMFSGASDFKGIETFEGGISTWDVSNVTKMGSMFASASSFNGDLSTWDVSSVLDMQKMFYFASSFTGNLSSWKACEMSVKPDYFDLGTGMSGEPQWGVCP